MGLKVSVIIPVYNGEQFIARAIESVLAQTYPAHEIVVINDGSKDKTEDVLKGFGGRIRFKTIPNGGVSNARNQGIKMATGDLIAFLDADDVWKNEKLALHEELFSKYPDVGFSCCNYLVFNPYLKKEVEHFDVLKGYSVTFNAPISGDDALKVLAALNFVGTASTVILKKAVLDRVGVFNTAYRQAEDYELWMRAAMVTSFIVLSQVLVDKKTHATNLTNDQFEMNSYHKAVLIDFLGTYGQHIDAHHLRPAFLDAIALVNYNLGDISYNLGRIKDAFGFYWKSFDSHKTLKSFLRYAVGVTKKSIRFLSFGIISRKAS